MCSQTYHNIIFMFQACAFAMNRMYLWTGDAVSTLFEDDNRTHYL